MLGEGHIDNCSGPKVLQSWRSGIWDDIGLKMEPPGPEMASRKARPSVRHRDRHWRACAARQKVLGVRGDALEGVGPVGDARRVPLGEPAVIGGGGNAIT